MARTQCLTTLCAIVLVLSSLPSHCIAQNNAEKPHGPNPASIYSLWPNWPKARAEDVQSPQNLVKTYFEILSGSAKSERDWDRFRSLFLPDGRFVAVKTWNSDPHLIPDVEDTQKMIERLSANLRKADLEERPLEIQVREFADFVQISVTSETHIRNSNGDLSSRFAHSFELLKDADRYWIIEVSSEMVPNSFRPQ